MSDLNLHHLFQVFFLLGSVNFRSRDWDSRIAMLAAWLPRA